MTDQFRAPLLSLIVPHYNMLDTLPRLLDSVLQQTMRDLEVVLVDDGSAHSPKDIVTAYRNKGLNIGLLALEENKGTKRACIAGLLKSRGRLIAIASADDFLLENDTLEYHTRLLLREGADIVHASTLMRDLDSGRESLWAWASPLAPALEGGEILASHVRQNLRAHSMSDKIYTRDLWLDCLKPAESVDIRFEGEDYFLVSLLFALARRYRGSEKIIHFYNMTSQANLKVRMTRYIINQYRMLRRIAPVFRTLGIPDKLISGFESGLKNGIRWRVEVFCECFALRDATREQAEMFRCQMLGVEPLELAAALRCLSGRPFGEKSPGLTQRMISAADALEKMACSPQTATNRKQTANSPNNHMAIPAKDPLLSLIVPHYNMLGTLPRLLDSILQQSLRDLEVVLVDDGSERSPHNIAEIYRAKGLELVFIELGNNRGTRQACIAGLRKSRGRIIAFANADDFFLERDALEYHARMLLREDADIVHANTLTRDLDNGGERLWAWDGPLAPALEGQEVLAAYVRQNLRAHSLCDKLYTRDLWFKCLKTAESVDIRFEGEDHFLLSLLFAQARRYRGSEKIISLYNVTPLANRQIRLARYIVNQYRILRRLTPVFRAMGIPDKLISGFEAGLESIMRWRGKLFCEHFVLRDSTPEQAEIFRCQMLGVDPLELATALRCLAGRPSGQKSSDLARQMITVAAALEKMDCSPHGLQAM